jgi:hypothetical protein
VSLTYVVWHYLWRASLNRVGRELPIRRETWSPRSKSPLGGKLACETDPMRRDFVQSIPVSALADLPGAELTTTLLGVARDRAARRTPTQVLEQYERDRFVGPIPTDAVRVAEITHRALAALAGTFEAVSLSPLAPFALHAAVARVSQNNVVTTMRGSEIAADPTTVLALEASVRRRLERRKVDRTGERIRLSAVQRVTRAQQFNGPRSFSHFTLLGLVTAGRDTGNHEFELESLVEHVLALAAVARAVGFGHVVTRLTDQSGSMGDVLAEACELLAGQTLDCSVDHKRTSGRGYYPNLCLKLFVVTNDGEEVEVGDGGLVDWTQQFLHSRKERCMTSGLSIERLALLSV